MSWFNNDSAFASESSSTTRRFWMKNNTDREITFIDGPTIDFNGTEVPTPLQYMEYNLNMNGHWRNWFTKNTDPSQDFLKDLGHRASKVAALTVIDHSEWTDRKGNLHKDEVVMYVVKRSSTVWKQIERYYATHGSLQGQRFRISRMGDKSPGAGSLLEHIGPSSVYNPEQHKPFDYFTILAPKTKEELMDLTNPDKDDFVSNHNQQSWGQPQQQSAPPPPPQQNNPPSAWGQQPPPPSAWGQQPTPQKPPQQYGAASQPKDIIPF